MPHESQATFPAVGVDLCSQATVTRIWSRVNYFHIPFKAESQFYMDNITLSKAKKLNTLFEFEIFSIVTFQHSLKIA
jgi:hypothetical protein